MLLLVSQQFVPHGHCYLWQPRLVGLHVISDGLIALAYFSIPLGLLYFTRQRKDLPFVGIFLLFGAFIVCCGLTHLFAVWTLWHPNYWLSGTMKALTAAVSLYTGWQLIPLIPLALALKSPQELEAINQKLQAEIADRKLIEQNLRQSEQELKASKQFQKLLMDNIPQMIFWKDRECVYQGGNAHFLKAAGLNSSEDILGKQDWNLPWSDEEAVFYSECDRRVIASGEAEINTVENRYRADGSMIWSVTNKVPLFDERGEVMGILCTYQDITDQKQAEEAVRQSEAALRQRTVELEATLEKLETTQTQLIQSEKMSSLGQLVAGLAHEINNPVSFIHGNLGHVREYAQDLLNMIRLYQQYYPNPKEAIEDQSQAIDLDFIVDDFANMLNSMGEGTRRIKAIVQSLRNFSRLDESGLKTVDLHEGIDSTLMVLNPRIGQTSRRCAIEIVREHGDIPPIECYAGDINQVLINLLNNAIDALEETRALCSDQEDALLSKQPIIRVQTAYSNQQVTITIADNGPGISQEIRTRVFDPFFTTKPMGQGTGLGLYVSHKIVVQDHGGNLLCQPNSDGGTMFIVSIPVRQSALLPVSAPLSAKLA